MGGLATAPVWLRCISDKQACITWIDGCLVSLVISIAHTVVFDLGDILDEFAAYA